MIAAYAVGAACLLCSAAVGAAIVRALGWRDAGPVCVPIGFAALIALSALAIGLPGRGVTLAVLIGAISLACGVSLVLQRRRDRRAAAGAGRNAERPGTSHEAEPETERPGAGRKTERPGAGPAEPSAKAAGPAPARASGPRAAAVPVAASAILFALGSIPFALGGHVGVLGEGVYTNDHAAQLYWTDWLQSGFGPEPTAVAFGYPIGPQALTAALALPFGASLIDAFNGLLLAICALTALGALSALRELAPGRRLIAAVLVGLPYLGASYLAQSAFKETVMAALVLCLAVALSALGRGAPWRAVTASVAVLAAGALFAYSLPGLAWFLLGIPLWLALEVGLGRRLRVRGEAVRAAIRSRRGVLLLGAGVVLVAAAAVLAGPRIAEFAERIGSVQSSVGRLGSPVWPGEALGVWPEGDFRLVRGEVALAYPATLLGLFVAALGAWGALRRRDLGLLALLVACGAIYVASFLFASIYVEAKALAIVAPLVMLAGLRTLLGPEPLGRSAGRRGPRIARHALAAVFVIAAGLSTLLALRAAPVGFQQRGEELEQLAEVAEGDPLLFLGVDRFGSYWLRGTRAESPGGYFAPEVSARPQKAWQQGDPLDFDSVEPIRIDRYDWAITSAGEYQSAAPPNWREVERTDGFVLWRREGETPFQAILSEGSRAADTLECRPDTTIQDVIAQFEPGGEDPGSASAGERGRDVARVGDDPDESGLAGLRATLLRAEYADRSGWSGELPIEAPGSVTRELELAPGTWDLSLQYASQASITVQADGSSVSLPPSLSGMYLSVAGGGSFWPAGRVEVTGDEAVTVTVTASAPTALEQLAGATRLTWVGDLAATRIGAVPQEAPLHRSCGRSVDHVSGFAELVGRASD